MSDLYILIDHEPVREPDPRTWGRWMEDNTHVRVAETTVGDHWISTVFLGIDHRFGRHGPPILFETMVFDKDRHGLDQRRYATWDEAAKGHEEMVWLIQQESPAEPGAESA